MAFSLKKLRYSWFCAVLFVAAVTKCDNADVFKTIEKFPYLTALYSTTATYAGANLQCVTLELTQFDAQNGTATYTWYFKTEDGAEAAMADNIMAGASPYEVNVVTTTDPDTVWTAILPFTDDKTCFILKRQDINKACVLWVNTDSVDNVSDQCIQENQKICGQGVLLYDKDMCKRNPSQ